METQRKKYKDEMKKMYLKPQMTVFEIVTSCLLQGRSDPPQGQGKDYEWGD